MDHTTTPAREPAEIEADIRRTQDEMSRTVDRIGDQLTPRNIMNALFDKAESKDIDARFFLDQAKRNPLALAMIGGGALWLISDSDAKLPAKMPSFGSGSGSGTSSSDTGFDSSDPYHRDYVSHMERIEWQPEEDQTTYQRRRDLARANYFMLEQRHDEDEHGFRQRLDDMAESFRTKRRAWSDSGHAAAQRSGERLHDAADSLRDTGSAAVSRSQDLFAGNPLIGGLIAAAVGAIAGTALPTTRTEEEQLGDIGHKARDIASEQKDKLTDIAEEKAQGVIDTVREKKDALVAKAEEHAQPSGQAGQQQDPSSGDTGGMFTTGESQSGQSQGGGAGYGSGSASGSTGGMSSGTNGATSGGQLLGAGAANTSGLSGEMGGSSRSTYADDETVPT